MTTDLAQYTYGDLVAALRKDLLLDATTDVLPGTILAALLDQNGKAAFLQLPTSKQLAIATGTGAATFSASPVSAGVVKAHGLGRVPVFAAGVDSQNASVWYSYASPTSTNVTFQGNFYTATSGTFSFTWIAIG